MIGKRSLVSLSLFAAGGTSLGVAWVHPDLAAFAWLAVVAVSVALARVRRTSSAFAGMWLTGTLARWLGLPWLADMNRIALQQTETEAELVAVVECLTCALPVAVFTALSFQLCRWLLPARRRPLAVPLWLPLAWAAGEHVGFVALGISNEAWLTTQWTVRPVLRVLGHLGWWPTLWMCLFVCAGVGVAAARRERRWLAPLLLLAVPLALPPLPDRNQALLDGIAAVHVSDELTLPHGPPPGEAPHLVLWPEDARHLRPLVAEGGTRGARIRPLLPGSDAVHLVGLVTRSPHRGLQNQLVEVHPDGSIGGTRAKRLLLLLGEQRFLGFGNGHLTPGRLPATMDVGGRRYAVLICGELLSRDLVAEAVGGGGQVLLAPARDHIMTSKRALRHMMAVQVLRSVEFGVPSVRSSLAGEAYFVSSDGRVLARSQPGQNGFLFFDEERGARDVGFRGQRLDRGASPAPPPPDVAVLYAREAPRFRTPCPEGRCAYHPLDDFECPAGAQAPAVIVAGHGKPPRWLSHGPEEIARAVRCFEPELVVIDSCLGASGDLLAALGELDVVVVAATTLIPGAGLVYEPAFFSAADPMERARAVSLEHGELLRWRIRPQELVRARELAAGMEGQALAEHLVRRNPPLLAVPLGEAAGKVLVPVERERLRGVRTDLLRRRIRSPSAASRPQASSR